MVAIAVLAVQLPVREEYPAGRRKPGLGSALQPRRSTVEATSVRDDRMSAWARPRAARAGTARSESRMQASALMTYT